MKTKFVGLRFDADMLAKADARAESLGMTRSEYILKCVRNELITGKPGQMVILAEEKHKRSNGKA